MNKQEIEKAIKILKCQINDLTSTLIEKSQYPFRSSIERQIESLEIAISALEQQLTNGWIPEIMKEVLGEEATNLILSSPEEFKKWLERGIWNCKKINELSNCRNGWIPVKDRLPEVDNIMVLIQDKYEYGDLALAVYKDGNFYFINHTNAMLIRGSKIKNVVAWHILPKPYKEDKDAERN